MKSVGITAGTDGEFYVSVRSQGGRYKQVSMHHDGRRAVSRAAELLGLGRVEEAAPEQDLGAQLVASQAREIDALRTLLAACLGDRDGILWVGDEAHLCRAVPTGIRK